MALLDMQINCCLYTKYNKNIKRFGTSHYGLYFIERTSRKLHLSSLKTTQSRDFCSNVMVLEI